MQRYTEFILRDIHGITNNDHISHQCILSMYLTLTNTSRLHFEVAVDTFPIAFCLPRVGFFFGALFTLLVNQRVGHLFLWRRM